MSSPSEHGHRKRLSQAMFQPFEFLARKRSKPDVKKPDVKKADSPRQPLSPVSNSSSSSPLPSPRPPSQEKKLKKSRRLSQVIGDVIVPSPQVTVGLDGRPTSFAQPYTLTRGTFVVPERRKLARTATAPAGPTPVVHSEHYPPRSFAASNSSLPTVDRPLTPLPSASVLEFIPPTPPLLSESGHSMTSGVTQSEMHSNCSSTRPIIGPVLRPKKRASLSKQASMEDMPIELEWSSTGPETQSLKARRRKQNMKRRMSLDLSLLSQSIASVTNTPTSASKPSIKRSRSLWDKKKSDGCSSEPEESFQRSTSPFTDKERALNVKRARKMAQLFGSEPPQALFQISHLENGTHSSSDGHRTSLTTILSISTTNLLSVPPRRERTISDSSSLIFENSPPVTPVTEPEVAPLKQLTPIPTRASTPAGHVMPFAFTPVALPELPKLTPISEKEFRQRRLRAVKLSKFFGVQIDEIRSYLPEKNSDRPGTAVGIETGTFWDRSHNHKPQQADMKEVIHRLRDLRAS